MQDKFDLSGLSEEAIEVLREYGFITNGEIKGKEEKKKEEATNAPSSLYAESKSSQNSSNTSGIDEKFITDLKEFYKKIGYNFEPIEIALSPAVYTSSTKISELPRRDNTETQITAKVSGNETFTDGTSALAPSFTPELIIEVQEESSGEEDFKFEPLSEEEKTVQEISENIERQLNKPVQDEKRPDDKLGKSRKSKPKKAKKKAKKPIKSARGRTKKYIPHKKRSIWEKIANRNKYEWGYYDDLLEINPDDLPEDQKEFYWEELEELEDAEHDYNALQAKKAAFAAGIAAIGIGFLAITGTAVYKDITDGSFFHIGSNQEIQLPATEIVTLVKGETNLKLEVKRARGMLLSLEDQDYLKSRINKEFIPEDATEEEMLDIMQEAWRSLEPDVQEWVREPYRLHEAELKKEEEEARRKANQAEIESRNTDNQTEEKELEIGE